MRCKSTLFYVTDQIFFVLLQPFTVYLVFCMRKYIKYLGISAIVVGLLLFGLHVIVSFRGNALLFTGLTLILGGVVAFVKGEKQ